MKERLHQLLHKLTSYYEENLWGGGVASPPLQYLMGQRNFTEEMIRKFRIGFAPNPSALEAHFTPTEFDLLASIGHVYEGSKVDLFVNRVIFPVMDPQGRPCGFSGRIMSGDPDARKYINSGSSEVFKKGDFLFGLNLARESVWKANNVILCEGYTDVIAFHQTGTPIAVGAMGTHFTESQLLLLGQYSMNLHLTFDADAAGDIATQKSKEMALKMGFKVSQIVIPGGMDPDEYLLPKS